MGLDSWKRSVRRAIIVLVARGRRRWTGVISLNGVALALLLSACGQAATATVRQGPATDPVADAGVVPWASLPAAPIPPYGPALAAASPCRSGDVRVTVGGHNGASQQQFTYIDVTNTSNTACAVSGYPDVVGEGQGITPTTPSSLTKVSGFNEPGMQYALGPGATAGFTVEQSDSCDSDPNAPSVDYQQLVITLPGGGNAVLTDALPKTCPGLAETIYTHVFTEAGPLAPLTAKVTAPASVKLGASSVDYSVTLNNPSSAPVSLYPCPNYTEFASDGPKIQPQTFRLNCSHVEEVEPGRSVTFTMRVAILQPPPFPKKYDLGISWQLDSPEGNNNGMNAVALGTSTVTPVT